MKPSYILFTELSKYFENLIYLKTDGMSERINKKY
jgi:hypothetical protein